MLVTGTFRYANTQPRAGVKVSFLPESNPQPDATGVLTAASFSVTLDVNGQIPGGGIALEQGKYLVVVGVVGGDKFRITVPDSAGTAEITTLMDAEEFTTPEITQVGNNWRIKNGYIQIKNIDTALWHTIRLVGPAGMEQWDIQIPGEA